MMPSSKVEVLKGWCTDGPTVTGIHICLYFQCQLQPFSHPAIKTKIPGGLWIQRTPDESRLDGSDKIQKTCKGEVFFLFSSSGNRVLLHDSSVHEIQTSGLESSETTVYKNLTANWWSMEEVNMVGCRAWIWNHQGFVTLGTRRNHRMTQQHQTQLSSRFYCLFLSSVKGDNRLPNQSPVSVTVKTQQEGTLEWITITSQSCCCNGRANLFSRDLLSPRLFTRRIRNN